MSEPGTLLAAPRDTSSPPNGRAGERPRAGRRRMRLSLVLFGALIVLVGAVAGVQVTAHVDDRVAVLAVARPVKAGQVIAAADVTTASVNVDSAVTTVPASSRVSVIGRIAAMPLAKGTLLGPAQVGPPVWPAAGEALAAVAVKPGRAPDGLAPGMRVTVLIVAQIQPGTAADTGGTATVRAEATVESVQQTVDQAGGLLVTVLTKSEAAQRIAAASGEAALVQHGAGG
jgi:SAF domain-containing protein